MSSETKVVAFLQLHETQFEISVFVNLPSVSVDLPEKYWFRLPNLNIVHCMDPIFYGENLHIYTARFDLDRQLQTASNTTTNFSFFPMCRQKNVELYCGRCSCIFDSTVLTTIPCTFPQSLALYNKI